MKANTFAVITLTIAIIAGVYWYLVIRPSEGQALTPATSAIVNQRAQVVASQLVSIKSFDTSLLSDPAFRSLISLAVPVALEAQGRLDPFAKLR